LIAGVLSYGERPACVEVLTMAGTGTSKSSSAGSVLKARQRAAPEVEEIRGRTAAPAEEDAEAATALAPRIADGAADDDAAAAGMARAARMALFLR
jgi:hypothetical protein